jgi:hypothetical protein
LATLNFADLSGNLKAPIEEIQKLSIDLINLFSMLSQLRTGPVACCRWWGGVF